MQEILLFGQVQAEHHQTLHKQLTGLTRMQGQSALERHAIFKPLPPPGLSNLPGGVGPPGPQQQELQKTRQLLNAPLNYIQLVGVADSEVVQSPNEGTVLGGSGSEDEDTIMANDKGESKPGHTALKWYLEYKNIPEPGKVSATSRAISKTRILEGDPIQFLKNLGFEYVSQYVITGDKFYDQDTTLFLHKLLQVPDQGTNKNITFPALNTVPDLSTLTALDPSGGYVLQASITIADGNSSELKDKATQQLLAMKETLRSSVNLAPGDRLALDTRVPMRRM